MPSLSCMYPTATMSGAAAMKGHFALTYRRKNGLVQPLKHADAPRYCAGGAEEQAADGTY